MYNLSRDAFRKTLLPFFDDTEEDRVKFALLIFNILPDNKKDRWISWFRWDREPLVNQVEMYIFLVKE